MSKQTDEAQLRSSGSDGAARPIAGAGNTGEKTSDLRQPDEKVLNDTKLVSSVEDRLANLRDMTGPARGDRRNPAVESEADETVTDEPSDGEKTHEDSSKDGGADQSGDPDSSTLDDKQGTKKEDGAGKEEDGTVPQLPDAYVRAAVAYGWKEEDVKAEFQSNPDRALRTFSSIYQTRNKTTAEFAALGRQQRRTQETAGNAQATEKPKFVPVDTKSLREKYGDEAGPLIDMIDAQNKALGQVIEALPAGSKKTEAPASRPFESAVEESGIEQQVHQFFEGDSLKPYEKLYGKLEFGQTFNDLPAGQQEYRWRVLKEADLIAGGARLQGVNMPLAEALERAHLFVTQKHRDQVLVDGIKTRVVQRSKAISLRPSKGTKKPGETNLETPKPGTRTKEQLLSATQRKMDKLFGNH